MSVWKQAVVCTLVLLLSVGGFAMTQDKKARKYYDKGVQAAEASDFAKAEKQLKKAIDRDGTFWEAHLALGKLLAKQGRIDEAKAELNQALKQGGKDAVEAVDVLFSIARYENNLDDQARLAEKKLIMLGKSATVNEAGRMDSTAVAMAQAGRMDEAERLYRRLMELKPDYLYAYLNLGKILFQLKHVAKAEAVFQKAVDQGIDNAELDYLLGALYHDDKNFEAALPLLIQSQADPRFRQQTFPMVINCQISLKKFKEAAATCETYLREFPEAPDRKAVADRLEKLKKQAAETK